MNTTCPHCGAALTVTIAAPGQAARGQSPSEQTRRAAALVADYLKERVVRSEGDRIETSELIRDLRTWIVLAANGPKLSRQTLGRALALNGVESTASNGRRYYSGVRFH